jgi:hypothetical protein
LRPAIAGRLAVDDAPRKDGGWDSEKAEGDTSNDVANIHGPFSSGVCQRSNAGSSALWDPSHTGPVLRFLGGVGVLVAVLILLEAFQHLSDETRCARPSGNSAASLPPVKRFPVDVQETRSGVVVYFDGQADFFAKPLNSHCAVDVLQKIHR